MLKDALLCLNASEKIARGQECNGASSALGERNGIRAKLLSQNLKALLAHSLGHGTKLAVKSVNSVSKGIKTCTETDAEIIKLVKFSPKCESVLGTVARMLFFARAA